MILSTKFCFSCRLPKGLSAFSVIVFALCTWQPLAQSAEKSFPLTSLISPQDALLIAGPGGRIIHSQNETRKCIPASTLKTLTALTAIHHLGKSYTFRTEIYQDADRNLVIKGYGDPLLISEVWNKIADALAARLRDFKDLVLDDTFFAHDIRIPGVGTSTNPYDAPVGALCANFNTVLFKRDNEGNIVSAERQTPMVGFALQRIRSLGLKSGRHTLFRDGHEGAYYAGELLMHLLRERGVECHGRVRMGVVGPEDRLIYTYRSIFTLDQTLKKMLEFSNNFVANQILIATGAHVCGPPGTLDKGLRVISEFTQEVLHLHDIQIVEGSGISRNNRLSPLDMLAILKRFEPHRAMLVRDGRLLYKTGALKDVKTMAGYIEPSSGRPHYFVIFMNRPNPVIDPAVRFIKDRALQK